MDKDLARKRREEAQKLYMQQQAQRIAQQRLATAPKNSDKPSTPQNTFSARSVYTPPPAAPVAPARPEPVRPAPPAAAVPARAETPMVPPSKKDLEEMRAEMQEFAHESPRIEEPAATKPLTKAKGTSWAEEPAAGEEALPEVSVDDLVIESAALDAESPSAAPKTATLKLKLLNAPDLACSKCGSLIPDVQRGAFYSECRRCGEIMKTSAA